jgi:hypothetical protein
MNKQEQVGHVHIRAVDAVRYPLYLNLETDTYFWNPPMLPCEPEIHCTIGLWTKNSDLGRLMKPNYNTITLSTVMLATEYIKEREDPLWPKKIMINEFCVDNDFKFFPEFDCCNGEHVSKDYKYPDYSKN